jgi:hypothetical protein
MILMDAPAAREVIPGEFEELRAGKGVEAQKSPVRPTLSH